MLNWLVSYKKKKNSLQELTVSLYPIENLYAHNMQHF